MLDGFEEHSLGRRHVKREGIRTQQEKMKSCNAEAGDKKGDERKAFMSNCLKAGAPAAPMTQQDKMKVCNTKAGEKKGDERNTFMSECLKADKKS